MAISFPHSTRVLRNDGMLPTAVMLAVIGSILILWGVWFTFARIPLNVTCAQATLTRDGALVVQCPPGQVERLYRGAPATVIITSKGSRQIFAAVILRVADTYTRDLAPNTLEVYAALGDALPAGATTEVQVEIETLSPLQLLLRGSSIPSAASSGFGQL